MGKGGEDKKFLKIVSLIFSRHVSNNILFPDDYEYSNFEKTIKNKSDFVKNILQKISMSLFYFILYGFQINDDQFKEIIFEIPYNCENMTKDIFIETWVSLLNSCELYEVAKSILKLNEPFPISNERLSIANERLSIENERLPIANEQFPISSQRLSIANEPYPISKKRISELQKEEKRDPTSSDTAYFLERAESKLNKKLKPEQVRMTMLDHQE